MPPLAARQSKCLLTSAERGRVKKQQVASSLYLLLVLLCACPISNTGALIHVPNRHTVASIPGDLVIGILVPVHERPSPKQAQTRTCGIVREQYGIQRVEAAFRTIDSINNDPNILPNITLGIEIRDSCWHSPIALEQSIEFIRDAMAASEQSQAKLPALLAGSPGGGSGIGSGSPGSPGSGAADSAAAAAANNNVSSLCAPYLRQQVKKVKNIVGVVGPASSTDTVQVQNLLQLFNMPQVGYSATSRDLSNKNFFKYFLRVVPADKLQAQVMIDLMLAHNWTYVTVAYTEGSYGSSLMNAFRERAQEVGICFATLESMPPNADDAKFDELIDAIQKHPNARVVVCMCEGRTVGRLFAGFKRKNIINEYLVVGSDGWSDRFDVVEKQEEYALGGISIRIHSAYVDDFDDYYFALSPFTNHRNPWFPEFWEARFQCNLPEQPSIGGSPGTNQQQQANQVTAKQTQNSSQIVASTTQLQQRPFVRPPGAKLYNRTCTGRESLRNNHKQDAKMAFVQKSIITMALGLHSMQRAICPSDKPGLCPEMLPVNGSILLAHLMNVSFAFLGERVHFDEQGDPPGKYEILNFQRRRPGNSGAATPAGERPEEAEPVEEESEEENEDDNSGLAEQNVNERRRLNPLYDSYSTLKVHQPQLQHSNQTHLSRRRRWRAAKSGKHLPASGYSSTSGYEYVHVGSWRSDDGLSLFSDIHWPSRSAISADGTARSASSQEWQFIEPGAAPGSRQRAKNLPKSVCSQPCPSGQVKKIQSDSVKCCWICVHCRPNEYQLNEFKCKACERGWWPNPIRTGCEQIPIEHLDWGSMEALAATSIAIFGLTLTLATGIVFIRHNNTPVVKSTTRELSYMILIAMLLCYVNTFFLVAKPHKITCLVTRILPGFAFAMMYGALVAITWIIVLIECSIIVFMLIHEPPDEMLEFPSDQRVVLVCNTTTMGIIAPLGFDFFLIAMCTLYAFKTRNVPENFNEAKFIGFTMYTTLVIWIAFVVIYLSSEHKVTTLCLCISFSALFALLLLFFPRCYIIIFKPAKNNRSFFTTTKNVRCHIGYQIGSASATAAAAAALGGSSSGAGTGAGAGGAGTNQQVSNWTPGPATSSSLDFEQAPMVWSTGGDQWQSQPQAGAGPMTHWSRGFGPRWPQARGESLGYMAPSGPTSPAATPALAAGAAHAIQAGFRVQSNSLPSPGGGNGYAHTEAVSQNCPALAGLAQQPANAAKTSEQKRGWLARIFGIFSRRSQRKEIDKATSIQQHLRAIRHAENLDRQTHFRRSQVQRLVQRFDSINGPTSAFLQQASFDQQPANNNHWSRNLRSVVTIAGGVNGPSANQQASPGSLAARLAGTKSNGAQRTWLAGAGEPLPLAVSWALVRGEDGGRLLMCLCQLVGAQNVWRLAEALRRYCQARPSADSIIGALQSDKQQGPHALVQQQLSCARLDGAGAHYSPAPNSNSTNSLNYCAPSQALVQPLDLARQADRKLGLILLGYLAELAWKARDELAERMAEQGQQLNHQEPGHSLAALEASLNQVSGLVADANVVCKSALETANREEARGSTGAILKAPARETSHGALGGGGNEAQHEERHQGRGSERRRLAAPNAGRPSSVARNQAPLDGGGNSLGMKEIEDEDPIRRTLERIMGHETKQRAPPLGLSAASMAGQPGALRAAAAVEPAECPRAPAPANEAPDCHLHSRRHRRRHKVHPGGAEGGRGRGCCPSAQCCALEALEAGGVATRPDCADISNELAPMTMSRPERRQANGAASAPPAASSEARRNQKTHRHPAAPGDEAPGSGSSRQPGLGAAAGPPGASDRDVPTQPKALESPSDGPLTGSRPSLGCERPFRTKGPKSMAPDNRGAETGSALAQVGRPPINCELEHQGCSQQRRTARLRQCARSPNARDPSRPSSSGSGDKSPSGRNQSANSPAGTGCCWQRSDCCCAQASCPAATRSTVGHHHRHRLSGAGTCGKRRSRSRSGGSRHETGRTVGSSGDQVAGSLERQLAISDSTQESKPTGSSSRLACERQSSKDQEERL